ncbi:MAG: AAA family ATPase, partial [Dysgonamonadaceae bacterium]|nr:AAA family ATPase [Dysgonamonadaceae bacterium]
MNISKYKYLPYSMSNFGWLITENYAYVDKTRFIEMMEMEANRNHFFIRPRKFGKSLFFSMLSYYYDINKKKDFNKYFGELYIGKNPTPQRNSYVMLTFDFSGLDTSSEEKFQKSFAFKVQMSACNFLEKYKNIFPNAQDLIRQLSEKDMGLLSLDMITNIADNSNVKIFVIIDEYDHFANDLIAMGEYRGKDFYKKMVAANGLVRDFYERIKDATKTSVHRTFITGISPVMLDDLTSGYNIAQILTLSSKYNEMMGFTQKEVDWLRDVTGVNPELITVDMEKYYNGYLFNAEGENRVYNPAMVLYFFNQILDYGRPPKNIIDLNLRTDYGRLQKLVKNEDNRN